MEVKDRMGLCHRCEKRVKVLEGGHGPRSECNSTGMSMGSCYCYEPVKPVVLKYPDYGDTEYDKMNKQRAVSGGIMGARMSFDSIADCNIELEESDGLFTLFATSINKQKEKKDGKTSNKS
jgi:hypothetical protein